MVLQLDLNGELGCDGFSHCFSVRSKSHALVVRWDFTPSPGHQSQRPSYDGGCCQTAVSYLHP